MNGERGRDVGVDAGAGPGWGPGAVDGRRHAVCRPRRGSRRGTGGLDTDAIGIASASFHSIRSDWPEESGETGGAAVIDVAGGVEGVSDLRHVDCDPAAEDALVSAEGRVARFVVDVVMVVDVVVGVVAGVAVYAVADEKAGWGKNGSAVIALNISLSGAGAPVEMVVVLGSLESGPYLPAAADSAAAAAVLDSISSLSLLSHLSEGGGGARVLAS